MTGDAKPTEPEAPVTDPTPPKSVTGPKSKTPVRVPSKPVPEPASKAPAAVPEKPAAVSAPEKSAEKPAEEKPAAPKRALVIDDEPANRDFLMRLLEQASLEVHGAESGTEALKIADGFDAMALVVIDNKLPDMDGVDLLIKLRQRYPAARMVMATMLDERALMAKAFENGCNVFLVKPHGFMELFRRIQQHGTEDEEMNRMIIDQYGPRPYRG
jgi:CheY-like chemotaxis protein